MRRPLLALLAVASIGAAAGCSGSDDGADEADQVVDTTVVGTTTTVATDDTVELLLETGPAETTPVPLPPELDAALPTSIEISGRWARQGEELAVGSVGADAESIRSGVRNALAELGTAAAADDDDDLANAAPAWCSAVTPSDGASPWVIRVSPPAVSATIGGLDSAELVLEAAPVEGGSAIGVATFEVGGEQLSGPVEVTPAAVAAAGTFLVDLGDQGRVEGAYRCLSG